MIQIYGNNIKRKSLIEIRSIAAYEIFIGTLKNRGKKCMFRLLAFVQRKQER